jgi:hypothetical protein
VTANRILELDTEDGPFVEVSREPEGKVRIRFDWTINQPWHLTGEEAAKIGRALIEAAAPERNVVFVLPCPANIWLLGGASGCELGAGHDQDEPAESAEWPYGKSLAKLHKVTLRWGTGNAHLG